MRFNIRRNDIFAVLLLVVVAASAIPLAANRPNLWLLFDCLVFALLVALAGARAIGGISRAWFLPKDTVLVCLFLILVLWHVMQLLPFGSVLALNQNGLGRYGATITLVPGQTLLMLLNLLAYGAVFLIAFEVSHKARREHLIFTYFAFGIGAFAFYALYNYAVNGNDLLGLPRQFYAHDAAGTFVNRNSFATFLGLGLIVNLALAAEHSLGNLRTERPMRKGAAVAHVVVAALVLAALLATHSRMGLFASVLGGVSALALYGALPGAATKPRIGAGIIVVLGFVAVAALYGQGVWDRFGSAQVSLDVRMELYHQVWELIKLRPLLGFGAGAFEAAFPLVHHLPVNADVIWDRAHDTYLTLFVELGLVFGLIPILIVLKLVIASARSFFAGKSRLGAVICVATTLQVGVHSLVDFSLEIYAVTLAYVLLLGVSFAAVQSRNTHG